MINKSREVPVRIIVRKKGGHPAHGGAWKVALADFMTAMFALFLVLWLVTQSTDIKSAIAGYFQDPLGRASEHGSSIMPGTGSQAASVRPLSESDVLSLRRDRLRRTAENIKNRLTRVPDLNALKGYVEITMTNEGLRIELMEDSSGVFFETGKPVPSSRGEEMLGILGSELSELSFPVRIEGHTDARPYAATSAYTNWELSVDRANAARRIMADHGLKSDQITQVTGFADRQPRDPKDPYAARNRRITITMILPRNLPTPGGPSDSTSAEPAVTP